MKWLANNAIRRPGIFEYYLLTMRTDTLKFNSESLTPLFLLFIPFVHVFPLEVHLKSA